MISKMLKMQMLEDEDDLAYAETEKKTRPDATSDGRPAWMRTLHTTASNWLHLIPQTLSHLKRTVENIKVAGRCPRRVPGLGVVLASGVGRVGPSSVLPRSARAPWPGRREHPRVTVVRLPRGGKWLPRKRRQPFSFFTGLSRAAIRQAGPQLHARSSAGSSWGDAVNNTGRAMKPGLPEAELLLVLFSAGEKTSSQTPSPPSLWPSFPTPLGSSVQIL